MGTEFLTHFMNISVGQMYSLGKLYGHGLQIRASGVGIEKAEYLRKLYFDQKN
jgi:hypothetical protein